MQLNPVPTGCHAEQIRDAQHSFWSAVGMPYVVKCVEAETLAEAVGKAYGDDECRFCVSSWFIDIKDRFRIFSFKSTVYVSKESTNSKADLEIANSSQAKARLDGKAIGTRALRIVVPEKVTLSSTRVRHFLVSVYFGSDMNEYVYSNTRSQLSLEECLSIVKLLLENRVIYRGFLPRNTIETERALYLFDWEDASFIDTPEPRAFDHFWKTNFLLNWSYLFGYHELETALHQTVEMQEPARELPLGRYELAFKNITHSICSDHSLRNMIDGVVFGAELPLVDVSSHFHLRPNDIGHLMADLFPVEIDVLYDVLACWFRRHNERVFFFHTQALSRLVVVYFRSTFVLSTLAMQTLQYYALIPILMLLDDCISMDHYSILIAANSLDQFVRGVAYAYGQQTITGLYLRGATAQLPERLDAKLREAVVETCPGTKAEEINRLDKVLAYILDASSRGNPRVMP